MLEDGELAILNRLQKSQFRAKFYLGVKDYRYIQEKGLETIKKHAQEFVLKRLAPGEIMNDGKQTPYKGHPVFIAQHATATCCRGCLYKWHRIPKGQVLTKGQQEYVVMVIMAWITRQMLGYEKERN